MIDLFSLSKEDFKKALKDRQRYNMQLLDVIKEYVEKCPDWRFQQILQNIGVSMRDQGDLFYEESYETAGRVRETCGADICPESEGEIKNGTK